MRLNIRGKLILSIGAPLLLTYLGLLAWDYVHQRSAAIAQLQQSALEKAEAVAGQLDARLSGVMQIASAIATQIESGSGPNDMGRRMALMGALRNPWLTTVSWVRTDAAGKLSVMSLRRGAGGPGGFAGLAGFGGNGGGGRGGGGGGGGGGRGGQRNNAMEESAIAPPWFAAVKASGISGWSQPHEEQGRRVVTYAVPVVIDEKVAGAVGLSVPLEELHQLRGRPGPTRTTTRPFPSERPGDRPGERPAERLADRVAERAAERHSAREAAQVVSEMGAPTSPTTPPSGDAPAEGGGRRDGPPPDDGFRPPPADREEAVGRVEDFALFDAKGELLLAAAKDELKGDRDSVFATAEKLHEPDMAMAAHETLAGKSQVVRVAGLQTAIPSVEPDTHHWLAMVRLSSTKWMLVTAIPESSTIGPMVHRLWQRAAFLAAGLGVLTVVVLAVSVRISRPIEQLASAVDELAAGNLNVRVGGQRSGDELGRLADGFDRMTAQLREQVSALTEQTKAREKVEGELRIARQIQTDLLPRTFPPFPDRREFSLYAVNLAALQVAGDFYDFFFTSSGKLTLVIADVSGKGVPAALLMAVTRTVVRNLAQAGVPPAGIAEGVNRALIEDSSAGMFATMIVCQYEPATGRIVYVNAGHPPAMRLRPSEGVDPALDQQSPLLGVDADGLMGDFEEHEETLEVGDSLFLYTDGVSESRNSDGEMFGVTGVRDLLVPFANSSPVDVCDGIRDVLKRVPGGVPADDITMLVLRREE